MFKQLKSSVFFLVMIYGMLSLTLPIEAKSKKPKITVHDSRGNVVKPFQPNATQKQAAVDFNAIPGLIKQQMLQNTYSERLYIIREGTQYYRLLVVNNPQRLEIKKANFSFRSPLIIAYDALFPPMWSQKISDLSNELKVQASIFGATMFGDKTAMELFGY